MRDALARALGPFLPRALRLGRPWRNAVEQCSDVLGVFGPAQRPLIGEDVGELGKWQSLDDLGPVDQVIGVVVVRHPALGELDQPAPELRQRAPLTLPVPGTPCWNALPRRAARHDVQVANAPSEPVREQGTAAEDHEVVLVQVEFGDELAQAADQPAPRTVRRSPPACRG